MALQVLGYTLVTFILICVTRGGKLRALGRAILRGSRATVIGPGNLVAFWGRVTGPADSNDSPTQLRWVPAEGPDCQPGAGTDAVWVLTTLQGALGSAEAGGREFLGELTQTIPFLVEAEDGSQALVAAGPVNAKWDGMLSTVTLMVGADPQTTIVPFPSNAKPEVYRKEYIAIGDSVLIVGTSLGKTDHGRQTSYRSAAPTATFTFGDNVFISNLDDRRRRRVFYRHLALKTGFALVCSFMIAPALLMLRYLASAIFAS